MYKLSKNISSNGIEFVFDNDMDKNSPDIIKYLNGNFIINSIMFSPQASAPTVPLEGMVYANADHHLYYYNGSTWVQLDN